MNKELDKGDIHEATVTAQYVRQNHEKINHHGKRVDARVKVMLKHQRTGSSAKESKTINALADKYLRR